MHKTKIKIISYLLVITLIISIMPCAFADSSAAEDITSLVYTYAEYPDAYAKVGQILFNIRQKDERLGRIWANIMTMWVYANTYQTVNTGKVPRNLPDDDSLCIVVLGFKLNEDGSMKKELKERLNIAIQCAQKYPKAYIAVSGGPTAGFSVASTEGDKMTEYLISSGISPDRIITENRSLTTAENAIYLGKIIVEDCPSVTSLMIVTSDYHMPKAVLLFKEYMYLAKEVDGSREIKVVSNLAYEAGTPMLADTVKQQKSYVWSIAETFGVIR